MTRDHLTPPLDVLVDQLIAAARRWRSVEAGASVDHACDELADAVDALDRAEAGFTIGSTTREGQ